RQRRPQDAEDVVDRLRRELAALALEALDVLVGQLVEPLAAERRQQVASQRPLDRIDAAGLLPVGPRVSFDEARRELGQCGYLLLLLDLDLGAGRRRREHGIGTVREQVSLTPLAPLQRARLGLDRGPAALPVLLPVVESDHDVDFPAALAVRPDFHGHWPSPWKA